MSAPENFKPGKPGTFTQGELDEAVTRRKLADAEAYLNEIAAALGHPKDAWRIADCRVLAHYVADLVRNVNVIMTRAEKAEAALKALSETKPTGETPRTDAEVVGIDWFVSDNDLRCVSWTDYECLRDFARTLERERDNWEAMCRNAKACLAIAEERVEKAEAEVAALKRDAERYRWLRGCGKYAPGHRGIGWSQLIGSPIEARSKEHMATLDAAIDRARGGKP